MKIRSDFVTNSSSSNVIIAMKDPLTFGSMYGVMLKLEAESKEVWEAIGYGDLYDFSLKLAGHACGKTIESRDIHDKYVEAYWNLHWQVEAEKSVKKLGEDGAFLEELGHWNRVNSRDSVWGNIDEDEITSFPDRAKELKEEFPFVYMFDVNDFTGEEDFASMLRELGTRDGGKGTKIITPYFVLDVETYY